MSSKGWIKLYRQLLDSELWNMDVPYSERDAWIELLLLANHEADYITTKHKERIKINRGQHFTSIRKLAAKFTWSERRTRNYIKWLQDTGMITTKRHTDGTLLTIVNYGKFQGKRHTDDRTDDHTDDRTDARTAALRTRSNKNDKESIRTRARVRASTKPQERTYDMNELELKLLATNRNV